MDPEIEKDYFPFLLLLHQVQRAESPEDASRFKSALLTLEKHFLKTCAKYVLLFTQLKRHIAFFSNWAGEMAQCVNMLATKPDPLDLIPWEPHVRKKG